MLLHSVCVWDGTSLNLNLWGENSPCPISAAQAHLFPRPHPFAATALALSDRLRPVRGFDNMRTRFVELSLPSSVDGPLPSNTAEFPADAHLEPWRVPTVPLTPRDAVFVLTRLPVLETAAPSTLAWRAVAFWVVGMLARNKVLPTLVRSNTGATPGWTPMLDDTRDLDRLRVLVDAMPQASVMGTPPSRDILIEFATLAMKDLIAEWTSRQRITVPPKWPEPMAEWVRSMPRNNFFTARGRHLQELLDGVEAWTKPAIEGPAPNLMFRLNLPDENGAWTVDVLLAQPNEEVPFMFAADARGAALEGTAWAAFEASLERRTTDLLRNASAIFPTLATAMQRGVPHVLRLNSKQAAEFLCEIAPRLKAAGDMVLVPGDMPTRVTAPQVTLHLDAYDSEDSLFSHDRLLKFDFRIALGGEEIDIDSFLEAASNRNGLIRIGSRWVVLDEGAAARIARMLTEHRHGPHRLGDALRLALGDDEVSLHMDGLLSGLETEASLSLVEPPATLHGELRPYQTRGLSWMDFVRSLGLGACLADDMGLGKTVQLIALLLIDKERGKREPVLLICPTSVVGNWQREVERFGPNLRVHVHHGLVRERTEAFAAHAWRSDIVVTTYGIALRDVEMLQKIAWRGIVLDEAQNVKNPASAQARAVRSLPGGFRIALTGTPVENRLSDLWSIMQFLNPGLLGTQTAFSSRFAIPIERNGDTEKLRLLRQAIGPLVLRRHKSDPNVINDLPEKQEMKTYCPLMREQAVLYKALVDEMVRRVEESTGMQRRAHILATMMRLKQVCNHPAHALSDGSPLGGRSGKLARLEEMLEEVIESDERALVFTQFREWGERLQDYLREHLGCEVLWLHGGTPRKKRDELVERFNTGKGPAIFVLSLKAGGTGLNLIGANHVFHYDRWWNPAVENQATDRAFRIGQTRNVQVHKMIALGTLEESIDSLIERKIDLADGVLGSGEEWLTELSTSDLRQLVTLREDLVEEEL